MGVDKKVIDKQIEDDLKDPENKVKKNEVKPEVKKDKLLSTHIPIVSKTKLGSMVRPVKPGSARDKMIAKNELRHGSDSIVNKRKMNADFQSMKKGVITKADFIKQYPKSQTAIKSKLKALESYEPYDLVLDYVCLLYTSPSPRDLSTARMPSSA